MSWLNEENCKLNLDYYSVLFHYTAEWEETFWTASPYFNFVSDTGKTAISRLLFGRLNFMFSNTLEYLYQKVLAEYNPIYAGNKDLAPNRIREEASGKLKQTLCNHPELLFENRETLRTYYLQCVSQHTDAVNEILARIQENREEIQSRLLSGKTLHQIIDIRAEAADCHRRGRRTVIIHTDAGSFVYKPHSMHTDVLLKKLVDSTFPHIAVIPETIDRTQYGFAEFIYSNRARNQHDSDAFIHNLGGTVCLLYIMGATDFHVENILPAKTCPALIDLETILSLGQTRADSEMHPERTAYERFFSSVLHSVRRSGLLPHKLTNEEFSPLISAGALSILPIVNEKTITAEEAWEHFEAGFRKVYETCMAKKAVVSSIIAETANCPIRVLLRNTNDYAKQLQRLYTVTALSSQEVTNKLIANMQFEIPSLTSEQNRDLSKAEKEELLLGDIPYFYVLGNGHDLYNGEGTRVQGFWDQTATENALFRLNRLSEKECTFELEMIHQSMQFATVPVAPAPPVKFTQTFFTETDFITELNDTLEYIRQKRVTTDEGISLWFGSIDDNSTFNQLLPSFGLGTLGIALFCAEYYATFADDSAKELGEEALASALALAKYMVTDYDDDLMLPQDISGLLRTLVRVGELLEKEEYIDIAKRLVDALVHLPDSMMYMTDFYSGTAGILYEVCTHNQFSDCPQRNAVIHKLAQKLLSQQNLPMSDTISGWNTMDKKRLISGLGHGQAGIGLALYAASTVIHEDAYRKAGEEAFRIEHALYSEKLRSWPDFRVSSVGDSCMRGICSGAPGMGLAYLKLHQIGIHDFDADLERAIQSCSNQPMMARDHLCCGNGAEIEFLLEAARVLHREEPHQEAVRILNSVLSRKKASGKFYFMPPNYRETRPTSIGFGTSGIGHILLRMLNPKLNPSFL